MTDVSLATLANCTPQEVFDHVVKGLASQGFAQSLNGGDQCAYRGDHGRRCAAGWCMTDQEYNSLREGIPNNHVEGRAWDALVGQYGVSKAHIALIEGLQYAHDGGPTAAKMRSLLKEVARAFALNTNALRKKA